MKYPIFASFIVFCVWLGYELHKHRNMEAKADRDFWERETAANNTRRKSLDGLAYIQIPFEALPMNTLAEDETVADCHQTLRELSKSPIVNLTGISNTDLKLQYGAPNLELLSQYDQCYTTLARTLQNWAKLLYDRGYSQEACQVLEFAMQTGTDISSSYKLLSTIYLESGRKDRIPDLIPVAEGLNSSLNTHIVTMLKELAK